ncbi:MAG: type I restriction endonuclease [Phormidium sp.]
MLVWFEVNGYTVLLDSDVAPGKAKSERSSYGEVLLSDRLFQALKRINPNVPSIAIKEAIKKLNLIPGDTPQTKNNNFRNLLLNGMSISYQLGKYKLYNELKLVDYSNIQKNDWLVIQNFTVFEGKVRYSPEIVIFINGLPIGIIDLIETTSNAIPLKRNCGKIKFCNYKLPTIFSYVQILVISNGNQARVGNPYLNCEQFIPWHSICREEKLINGVTELEILIQDFFDKRSFFKSMKDFIEFTQIQVETLPKECKCRL